ncbi:MFS transporter [Streptomyces asoensis]|uniref:MFS transporter n=1 Tax=Streptomyces asoensis TaxID=249586 RepID=A0A6M4WWT3_9ACTN|nr:hypothetical protein [Streptomyces asoensis]QJT04994.1 MFS transporter [Streptomyces asoensis]
MGAAGFSLGVVTAGQLLYTTVEQGAYTTHLLPAALLVGTGIAIAHPAAVMLASAAASLDDQGTASGFLVTCQQAGGATGVAAVTAIRSVAPGTFWSGPYSLWGCFAFAAASLPGCLLLLPPGEDPRERCDDPGPAHRAPRGTNSLTPLGSPGRHPPWAVRHLRSSLRRWQDEFLFTGRRERTRPARFAPAT